MSQTTVHGVVEHRQPSTMGPRSRQDLVVAEARGQQHVRFTCSGHAFSTITRLSCWASSSSATLIRLQHAFLTCDSDQPRACSGWLGANWLLLVSLAGCYPNCWSSSPWVAVLKYSSALQSRELTCGGVLRVRPIGLRSGLTDTRFYVDSQRVHYYTAKFNGSKQVRLRRRVAGVRALTAAATTKSTSSSTQNILGMSARVRHRDYRATQATAAAALGRLQLRGLLRRYAALLTDQASSQSLTKNRDHHREQQLPQYSGSRSIGTTQNIAIANSVIAIDDSTNTRWKYIQAVIM